MVTVSEEFPGSNALFFSLSRARSQVRRHVSPLTTFCVYLPPDRYASEMLHFVHQEQHGFIGASGAIKGPNAAAAVSITAAAAPRPKKKKEQVKGIKN